MQDIRLNWYPETETKTYTMKKRQQIQFNLSIFSQQKGANVLLNNIDLLNKF